MNPDPTSPNPTSPAARPKPPEHPITKVLTKTTRRMTTFPPNPQSARSYRTIFRDPRPDPRAPIPAPPSPKSLIYDPQNHEHPETLHHPNHRRPQNQQPRTNNQKPPASQSATARAASGPPENPALGRHLQRWARPKPAQSAFDVGLHAQPHSGQTVASSVGSRGSPRMSYPQCGQWLCSSITETMRWA